MRVTTGRVVAGKVVVEGFPLEEGTTVTVIAPNDAEPFALEPTEEEDLLRAIAETERGDVIDGDQVLATLRPRT